MEKHSIYFGEFIWRNTEGGHRLRWTATVDCRNYAADTLDGIRRCIRVALGIEEA